MHMTAINIGVLDAFLRPVNERLLEFILTHIFAQRATSLVGASMRVLLLGIGIQR